MRHRSVGVALSLLALAAACSGGGNSIGAATMTACEQLTLGISSDCRACVESSCPPQVNQYGGGCADFLACACPGGTYSASAAHGSTCAAKTQESTCATDSEGLGNCLKANCGKPCGATTNDAGGGG